jgi:hypothetical protein
MTDLLDRLHEKENEIARLQRMLIAMEKVAEDAVAELLKSYANMTAIALLGRLSKIREDGGNKWTLMDDCRVCLEQIEHTVAVHGHIDHGTPLHGLLQRTLALFHEAETRTEPQG